MSYLKRKADLTPSRLNLKVDDRPMLDTQIRGERRREDTVDIYALIGHQRQTVITKEAARESGWFAKMQPMLNTSIFSDEYPGYTLLGRIREVPLTFTANGRRRTHITDLFVYETMGPGVTLVLGTRLMKRVGLTIKYSETAIDVTIT